MLVLFVIGGFIGMCAMGAIGTVIGTLVNRRKSGWYEGRI